MSLNPRTPTITGYDNGIISTEIEAYVDDKIIQQQILHILQNISVFVCHITAIMIIKQLSSI